MTTEAHNPDPMLVDEDQGWTQGPTQKNEIPVCWFPNSGNDALDFLFHEVAQVNLYGEDRCPWWAGLEGEERCPWWAALHPEVEVERQETEGEVVEDTAQPLREIALEVFQWMVDRRRDWLDPPPSVLGEGFQPHWTDESGEWVPVWFPTIKPEWLMEWEQGAWVDYWRMVRGYWMEVAAQWPHGVRFVDYVMAWVHIETWAEAWEGTQILLWDEDLPLYNGYPDWLD